MTLAEFLIPVAVGTVVGWLAWQIGFWLLCGLSDLFWGWMEKKFDVRR